MNQRSIGVFDSGLGGLTAVRQLRRLMPSENIIYFGDTSRVPYGNRSRQTILKYARQDIRFLCSFDLKAIVIACGTVSSNCLTELREENPIPIIGVVEPAAQRAAAVTRNHRIGVAATRATISSGAFAQALRPSLDLLVFSRPCPLFVPLVEEGRFRPGDPVIELVAEEYLHPLRDNHIDTLVLGCTHYPLLADVIRQVMGPEVTLVDVGAESAAALQRLLTEQDALADRAEGSVSFYTSDRAMDFQRLATLFLGKELPVQATQIDISVY